VWEKATKTLYIASMLSNAEEYCEKARELSPAGELDGISPFGPLFWTGWSRTGKGSQVLQCIFQQGYLYFSLNICAFGLLLVRNRKTSFLFGDKSISRIVMQPQ